MNQSGVDLKLSLKRARLEASRSIKANKDENEEIFSFENNLDNPEQSLNAKARSKKTKFKDYIESPKLKVIIQIKFKLYLLNL